MEFSRREHWSGLPFPPPGDFPNPGIQPRSSALQADSLPSEPSGKSRSPFWVSTMYVTSYRIWGGGGCAKLNAVPLIQKEEFQDGASKGASEHGAPCEGPGRTPIKPTLTVRQIPLLARGTADERGNFCPPRTDDLCGDLGVPQGCRVPLEACSLWACSLGHAE